MILESGKNGASGRTGRYVGHAALNGAVSQLHARFPGFVFTPIGAPQAFYDGTPSLGHGPVGEPPKIKGLDVVHRSRRPHRGALCFYRYAGHLRNAIRSVRFDGEPSTRRTRVNNGLMTDQLAGGRRGSMTFQIRSTSH